MRWVRWVRWFVGVGWVAVALDVAVGLTGGLEPGFGSSAMWLGSIASVVVTGLLGIRIVEQTQGATRRVGAVLAAMSVIGAFTTLGETWAYAVLLGPHAGLPGATAGLVLWRASWLTAYAGLSALVMVFPDGHVAGPRWRILAWVSGVVFPLAWLAVTFQHKPLQDPFGPVPPSFTPSWFSGVASDAVTGTLVLATLGCLVASAVSVVVRYRRSAGETRLQLRALALASALLPAALAVCVVELGLDRPLVVTTILFELALVAIPGAVGLAVLRYRLYSIDRLINRAVLYGGVSLSVLCVYVVVSLGVGVLAGDRFSSWAVAAATASAVLAFGPIRRRVQDFVDRTFDKQRYAGVTAMRTFVDRVRRGDRAPEEVEEVLGEVLGDRSLRLLVRLRDAEQAGGWLDVTGHGTAAAPEQVVTPVSPGAAIEHHPSLLTRPEILNAVLDQARLPVEMVRLRVEIAATLAEVSASRARIVEASYEERRRLERDLHDGAQQRLVSLGLSLRLLERSLPYEAQVLRPALDDAVGEVEHAITDLRRIAAGVRPARLDDGLLPALHELARSTPIPVVVTGSPGRASAAVESAAYYLACEGVTNAVRHSTATSITIHAELVDDALTLRVCDNGRGGASSRPGSGLAGLTDRIAAHGGSLSVHSPAGQGTVLEAVLPCGS